MFTYKLAITLLKKKRKYRDTFARIQNSQYARKIIQNMKKYYSSMCNVAFYFEMLNWYI